MGEDERKRRKEKKTGGEIRGTGESKAKKMQTLQRFVA